MKYLITGGCGFIGFHLARQLIRQGHEVVIIDNFDDFYDPALKFQRAALLPEATIYPGDILDCDKLEEIFSHHAFDKVIHLAAQPNVLYSFKVPELYQKNNVAGTANVFEFCQRYRIKNTVFASSSSVYRNNRPPFQEEAEIHEELSIYAQTKRQNELLAREYHEKYGLNIIGLRMFNVYGTHGRPDLVFYIFIETLLRHQAININGTGATQRDFTHVDDVVAGIIKAADLNAGYEIINLGGGAPVDLETLAGIIEKHLGVKAKKVYLEKNGFDMDITFAAITKAKRLLDWEPKVKIEDGLAALVAWHRENLEADHDRPVSRAQL
jgi:UDP-glucuronate 4-epimerase